MLILRAGAVLTLSWILTALLAIVQWSGQHTLSTSTCPVGVAAILAASTAAWSGWHVCIPVHAFRPTAALCKVLGQLAAVPGAHAFKAVYSPGRHDHGLFASALIHNDEGVVHVMCGLFELAL